MNSRWQIRFFLIMIIMGYLLVGFSNASVAQEDNVDISATVLFEIEQNLCLTEPCGQMWRLSPSGERLFVFFTANYQLYVFERDGQMTQFDLSPVPAAQFPGFDFAPDSETSILFRYGLIRIGFVNRLLKYDLVAQTATEYLPDHRFISCNGDGYPPFRDFVRPFGSNWMVVCGTGSSTEDNRNISVIDLRTDTIHEVATLNDTSVRSTIPPWRRVYGSHDGTIYAILEQDTFLKIFPGYDVEGPVLAISKRRCQDAEWSLVEISRNQLSELGAERGIGSLTGVDARGNLYFVNRWGHGIELGSQFTKVSAQGDVVWVLSDEAFGINPRWLDVTADGNPIIVSNASHNTTAGAQIIEYEINQPLITDAEAPQAATANSDE